MGQRHDLREWLAIQPSPYSTAHNDVGIRLLGYNDEACDATSAAPRRIVWLYKVHSIDAYDRCDLVLF